MPTRKIKEFAPCDKRFKPCNDPSHDPPSMRVYNPGEYEHECPSCHQITRLSVFPRHSLRCS